MANNIENTITIAGRKFRVGSGVTDEMQEAEILIENKFNDLKKSPKNKDRNFERDVISLLINITTDYIEEKNKIKELKKEMSIKIDSLINRVELLL